MISAAVDFLKAHSELLLIAHVSPDGDTLGSCFALFGALTAAGSRVSIVCEEPVPQIYAFLPFADQVVSAEQAQPSEAVVCVDCADPARTGRCRPLFDKARYTLNIDHHGTNEGFAQANYVRRAGATAELVYAVLREMRLPVTPDVATCLYTAIVTDTGNFSYANTTPDTFRTAAALLETGLDLPGVNRMLFRTVPLRKTMLHGLAIRNMKIYDGGRIGISALSQEDLRACGASGEDAEGIIDSIRDVDTVEVAVLLRESTDGLIRVSMRGKEQTDVSRIAAAFGGGGHRLAAGCTLEPPLADAYARILAAVRTAVREA